uniref:Uncharacterized protein n=1 Tax=Timema bartmani TaxID=61472 RepID=A0A7R9EW80_9NEOP|nr:unnamed protein product [Timema bartmani]
MPRLSQSSTISSPLDQVQMEDKPRNTNHHILGRDLLVARSIQPRNTGLRGQTPKPTQLRPPPPLATYGCPPRDLLPSLSPMAGVYKRQWMRSRDSVIRWRGERQQMAEIKMPSGNVDKPVIEDNRDGTVSIKYDPKEEGLHELAVKYNGEHVQG